MVVLKRRVDSAWGISSLQEALDVGQNRSRLQMVREEIHPKPVISARKSL